MRLDDLVISVVVCPNDREPLLYIEAENILLNPRRSETFHIDGSIPVLLPESGTSIDATEVKRLEALGGTWTGKGTSGLIPSN